MQAIVAMSENRAIGLNGGLPWPKNMADLKWFKNFTIGKNLVFGSKTFRSLPKLKGRNFYVLTYASGSLFIGERQPDYHWVMETDNLSIIGEDSIVCGGASIYSLFLPKITEFFVTKIKGNYKADTFMPDFEHLFAKREKWAILEDKETEVWKYTK
jgi:dihydrofolate reductase